MIPGIDALRSFETLRLSTPGAAAQEKRHYRLEVIPGIDLQLPYDAGIFRVNYHHQPPAKYTNCAKFVNEKNRSEIVILDGNALGGNESLHQFSIRNWEPGDSYQPAGSRSPKKVKELFQENRVHLWDRRHWPVLELNGEIVWVRGFGAASKFSREQGVAPAVSLTYIPPHESNDPTSTS
jgi:tRNA(Ile)-lysidine synthase